MNANKETGLEVNAEETKCVVMLRVQHARKNKNIMGGNKSFERVEHFKYLKTTLTK
jgi:hypothetical protein